MRHRSRHPLSCLAALVLAAALAPGAAAQRAERRADLRDLVGRRMEAHVVRVADGDTIEARLPGEPRPIRIRLEGIDAPEQGEPFAAEALRQLRALVFDRAVHIVGRDVDRYNRLVARVVTEEGDAGAALVRAGLACHAYADDETLAREERRAREAGAGFWGAAVKPRCVARTSFSAREDRDTSRGTPPPAPGEPRGSPLVRDPAPSKAVVFRGNVRSRVYHAPACPNYTCRNCTRVFRSHEEAQAAGFRPAGDCLR